MKVLFFYPRRGSENIGGEQCKKAKEEDCRGAGAGLPSGAEQKIIQTLKKNDLLSAGQCGQSFEKNIGKHIANYENHLLNLTRVNQLKINAQTKKDCFSQEQNNRPFNLLAEKLFDNSGISVSHEMPLNKRAALACERLACLHAQAEHEHGAQANIPRAPEWSQRPNRRLKWRDAILEHHKRRNTDHCARVWSNALFARHAICPNANDQAAENKRVPDEFIKTTL